MSQFIHIVPYSLQMSLASEYNELISKTDASFDWILITDADVMFLTPKYGHLIQEAIERHPGAGMITCATNRVGASSQLTEHGRMDTPDLLTLRKVALDRYQQFGSTTKKISAPVSGLFMLFPRIAWKRVGGFKGDGRFGTDWRFSRDIEAAGLPLYRLEGLFLAHFYRLDGQNAS